MERKVERPLTLCGNQGHARIPGRKRHPELSEKEIAWKVARLMYLSDEGTQRLLEQARAKLC